MSKVSPSLTGAVSKKVSSTGSFLNQWRGKGATVSPQLVHTSRKIGSMADPGKPPGMEGFGFELVCSSCLATRGLLESEELPAVCAECGARDPWKGPFAEPRVENAEQLTESPFYLGATVSPACGSRPGMSTR
jgi:hypothetical protein